MSNDNKINYDILKVDIETIEDTDIINEFSKFTETQKLIIKTHLVDPSLEQQEIAKQCNCSNIYVHKVLNMDSVSKFISKLQLRNGINRMVMNFVLAQEGITKNLTSTDAKLRNKGIDDSLKVYEKFYKSSDNKSSLSETIDTDLKPTGI